MLGERASQKERDGTKVVQALHNPVYDFADEGCSMGYASMPP
jgi:hypothetical protein